MKGLVPRTPIETGNVEEPEFEEVYENSGAISTQKMERIVELLSDRFNLRGDSYAVVAFNDKGDTAKISFANDGFEVTIVVKDLRDWGIE